jgi:hypothetical protein
MTPRLELRFGSRALGVGIFYHAQKRLLYLHPFPGIALVIFVGRRPAPLSVKLPLMITKEMRRQLNDLGYTKPEVDALTPEYADLYIKHGVGPERPIHPPAPRQVQLP